MTGKEGQLPKRSEFSTIQAPEFLEESQSFYEQEPFRDAFQFVAAQTSTDPAMLRRVLTRAVRISKEDNPDRDTSDFLSDFRNWEEITYKDKSFMDAIRGSGQRKSFPKGMLLEYESALEQLSNFFSEYPYWGDYIFQKMDETFYDEFGNYRKRKNVKGDYLPTESYGKWVTDKIAREKRQVLLGINEIFSQEVPQTGSRQRRRWVILKSSELVKDDK